MKYDNKIMSNLKYGEYISLEELEAKLEIQSENSSKFGTTVDMLGLLGYIGHDNNGDISLRTYSSYAKFKQDKRQKFLSVSVSISAIVVATVELLSLIFQLLGIIPK